MLFIFVVPNVNYHTVASIMFSVAATSLIQMLFFGSIAILFSLRLNRVALIISTVVFDTFLMVYSVSIQASQISPSSQLSNSVTTVPKSYNYWSKNNKDSTFEYFMMSDFSKLDQIVNYVDHEKNIEMIFLAHRLLIHYY